MAISSWCQPANCIVTPVIFSLPRSMLPHHVSLYWPLQNGVHCLSGPSNFGPSHVLHEPRSDGMSCVQPFCPCKDRGLYISGLQSTVLNRMKFQISFSTCNNFTQRQMYWLILFFQWRNMSNPERKSTSCIKTLQLWTKLEATEYKLGIAFR